MTLTAQELITLGVGGAVLVGLCVTELNAPVPIVRLLCFILGIAMLGVALFSMLTD